MPGPSEETVGAALRYLVSGTGTTFLDYMLLFVCLRAGIQREVAVTLAYGANLAMNFFLHKHYTFGRRSPLTSREVSRFLVVVGINYLSTLGTVFVCSTVVGLPVMLGKVISTPVVVVTGFLLTRHFVFSERRGPDRGSHVEPVRR